MPTNPRRSSAVSRSFATKSPALAEQARARLEEMIITLQIAPGTVLSEGELSAATGFGRTPVREALKRLETDHLVRIIQRLGVQITEMDAERQLQALDTRRVLERLLAARAARRRTDVEAAQMREVADLLVAGGQRGEFADFMRRHAQASALIATAARNPYAATAIAPFHAISRRFYYLHYRQANDLLRATSVHAQVLRAIADGDEQAATAAVDAVLDYVEGFTRATLLADF